MSDPAAPAEASADGAELEALNGQVLGDYSRCIQLGAGNFEHGLPRFIHSLLDDGEADQQVAFRASGAILRNAYTYGEPLDVEAARARAAAAVERETRRSARRQQAEADRVEDVERLGIVEEPPAAPASPGQRFRLIGEQELEQQAPVEWCVEPIIPRGALAALVGQYDSYKSFIATDLAVSVQAGLPFLGLFPTTRAQVIYVLGEGRGQFGRRIRAYKAHRQLTGTTGVQFVPHAVQFMDRTETAHLIDAVQPLRPALIVVDTMARCMTGGEENSAKDVGLFVAGVDRLRHATGAAVLVIHHVGKGGDTRGSSALPGALDVQMVAAADGEFATISCAKMKDSERFKTVSLRRRVVDLGDGLSSLVLVPVENADGAPRGIGDVPPSVRIVLRGLAAGPARPTQLGKTTSLPERTLYDALRQAKSWGLIAAQNGGAYRLTAAGERLCA